MSFPRGSRSLLGADDFLRAAFDMTIQVLVREQHGRPLGIEGVNDPRLALIMATPYYVVDDSQEPRPSVTVGGAALVTASDFGRAMEQGPGGLVKLLSELARDVQLEQSLPVRPRPATDLGLGLGYFVAQEVREACEQDDPQHVRDRYALAMGHDSGACTGFEARNVNDFKALLAGGHLGRLVETIVINPTTDTPEPFVVAYLSSLGQGRYEDGELVYQVVAQAVEKLGGQDAMSAHFRQGIRQAGQNVGQVINIVSSQHQDLSLFNTLWIQEGRITFKDCAVLWKVAQRKRLSKADVDGVIALLRQEDSIAGLWAEIASDTGHAFYSANSQWAASLDPDGLLEKDARYLLGRYSSTVVSWTHDGESSPLQLACLALGMEDKHPYNRSGLYSCDPEMVAKLNQTLLESCHPNELMDLVMKASTRGHGRAQAMFNALLEDERLCDRILTSDKPVAVEDIKKRTQFLQDNGVSGERVHALLNELWYRNVLQGVLDPGFEATWESYQEGHADWQRQVNRRSLAGWRREGLGLVAWWDHDEDAERRSLRM